MEVEEYTFRELLGRIVDNRGRTCPTAESGTALIATNCIKDDNLYPVFEKVRWVDSETMETWFRGHPEPGDILFVLKGSPGRCCLVPNPINFCVAQDMVALRADESKVSQRFLFALLRSSIVRNAIDNLHVGTMIPHFKKGDFDQLTFQIPKSRKIQEWIGEQYFILSDKIELNRRMNATLEGMAQALFKSWFVDFDPVIDNALAAGNPIPDELAPRAEVRKKALANGTTQQGSVDHPTLSDPKSLFPAAFEFDDELGWIPEGWTVKPLSDFADSFYDGPHATPKKSETGAVFLGIKNLTGTLLDFSDIRWISEDDWPKWTKRVTPMENDVVFSYEATLGFFALIPRDLRCCLGRRLALIRPKSTNGSPHFLFHWLVSRPFQDFLESRVIHGATVNRISLTEFPSYPILIPPEQMVQYFESLAGPIWDQVHAKQTQVNALSKLRDTLLPKLISGELSTKELS